MFKFPWTRNAEELGAVEIQVNKRLGELEIEMRENKKLSNNSYETARLIAEKARSVVDDLERIIKQGDAEAYKNMVDQFTSKSSSLIGFFNSYLINVNDSYFFSINILRTFAD